MAPRRKHPLIKKFCEHCGTEIEPRKVTRRGYSRGYWTPMRFCSGRCRNLARGEMKGWLDKHGYRYLRFFSDGPSVHEHRIEMEGILGRELLPGETVHHKNGDRADNRPENLELFSGRHCKGSRVSDQIKWAKETLALYGDLSFTVEHIERGRADLLQAFPYLADATIGG